MKALSLWNPWAIMIPLELKQLETRSWRPNHNPGLLAIHAAKHWTFEEQQFALLFGEQFRLQIPYPKMKQLLHPTFGAMLCIVRCTAIYRTEDIRNSLSLMERAAGNYADNRFAFKFELVEVFDKPIPAKGKQGLFEWERPAS